MLLNNVSHTKFRYCAVFAPQQVFEHESAILALRPCEPFRERVNWEEWGLYDYLQVVKEPMDLGTIRSKLAKNEYKKPAEFARDMRLVWSNCKLYNQDGSDLYLLADELAKKFEDRVKAMKLDVGPVPKADKSIPAPSLEDKICFSQNIYKINPKDLGVIVKLLEEQCPKALDKSSPDELDIVIDNIDNKTFRDLEKIVLEKVPEGSREPIATPKSSKKSRRPPSKKTKTDV
ncbi:Transcription initiation factor TFIID, subunit BDF1 and related bromodomain proteins [Plasmopara halstedii]|uniref:Transcription initiation factor TFIID, subunit BDF1 and related bromodomain proteins n=1 Tax=Plasmopara halstedii TaxID=4781 RepID=A0A0P1AWM9_PLAHL|nr:Transcription initiation factor TFIID, subunit BDF1 and related bromodomain proteins [Plasmopara halstedii]CEG45812.1 Transcription initiation factor TFIID, subunit BDF1 and related bromodomain proteins [Plasmopara halstedii]|eukprot:XP_024582181.1 Transcription initiation factor TFIID, subunit BDF1 and related bromodomain proteins [Plasmopara halstedii]